MHLKAFAKFAGNYEKLNGGHSSLAWMVMTGCEDLRVYKNKPEQGGWFKGEVAKERFRDAPVFEAGLGELLRVQVSGFQALCGTRIKPEARCLPCKPIRFFMYPTRTLYVVGEADMSTAPLAAYYNSNEALEEDAMWELLKEFDESNFIMSCSIGGDVVEKARDDGLVERHAYGQCRRDLDVSDQRLC